MIMLKVEKLAKLHSHAEYGGKLVGDLTVVDLSHAGDWDGSFDELVQSIRDTGIQIPLRIDKSESGELMLRNGHHRAVIAIQLGLDTVPVTIREGN